MTPEEAAASAMELNATGKHRDEWWYYPTYHDRDKTWFVMRRRKLAEIHTAIFSNGEKAGLEK